MDGEHESLSTIQIEMARDSSSESSSLDVVCRLAQHRYGHALNPFATVGQAKLRATSRPLVST